MSSFERSVFIIKQICTSRYFASWHASAECKKRKKVYREKEREESYRRPNINEIFGKAKVHVFSAEIPERTVRSWWWWWW